MKKTSILIINRWDDEMACYEDYIDHRQYHVFYLTNQKGLRRLKANLAKDIYVTDHLDDISLDHNVDAFIEKMPSIDKIIAFSEVDQELAAFLRTKLSVQGMNCDEVKKFRNKVEMKCVARRANICVPNFTDLNDESNLLDLIDKTGYPIILKPKNGVSSEGVYKVNSEDELNPLLTQIDRKNYECEQFIQGKIYHADGLVQNGKFLIFKVSEYINTCYEYTHGLPLGSVIIDDHLLVNNVKKFAQKVIHAFSLQDGAFHLEFIIDKNQNFYFLEIGARVGGAQVPYLFKYVYGVNLFHEWINIQMSNNHSLKINTKNEDHVGGWLLFPEPRFVPCKVEYCHPLKDSIPFILYEKLAATGHIFYGGGEYRDVSGTYLYKSSSTNEIKHAINQTINNFFIKTISIGEQK